MPGFESLRILGFDHVEFAVADLDRAAAVFHRLGFEKQAERETLERRLRSYLLVQNQAVVMLSQSSLPSDPVARFVTAHGDGVMSLAYRCADATSALEVAVGRGAEVTEAPRLVKRDFGSVHYASIQGATHIRHAFVSREGNLFAEGFDVAVKLGNRGTGLTHIDHVTWFLESGQLPVWITFYERIFNLTARRREGATGGVITSPNGEVQLLAMEPDGGKRVREFLEVNHGSGIQHVAFATPDIAQTLRAFQRDGVPRLEIPASYYEALGNRLSSVREMLSQMAELGVLVEGDSRTYLLHAFTGNVVGPFNIEVIERRGNPGFGESNISALDDAVHEDRIRRGILEH